MVPYIDLVDDTICAQITAPGYAGVAVIRISGPKSVSVARLFCPFLVASPQSHRAYFGELVDADSRKVVDQVLLTCFSQGQSFTGDEVVEISCHGNPVIAQRIISFCLAQNCRLAERGEFSFRAFYNGKIDLVQAESINQLVMSQTQSASDIIVSHLEGSLSDVYSELEYDVVEILSHLEASIDFVEQDILPESYRVLQPNYEKLLTRIVELIESYDVGKNLTNEWKILLLGDTNVGKSSLFNCFFKQDKAIVTEVAGTTRDLVQDQSYLGNFSVRFVDSAGLRDHPEKIEQIGIGKTLAEIDSSSVILWVIDSSQKIDCSLLTKLSGKDVFAVFNKVDLISQEQRESLRRELLQASNDFPFQNIQFVSATTHEGVDELLNSISGCIESKNGGDYKSIVTQSRHFDHLKKIGDHLGNSLELLIADESPDIISQETQMGLMELHKIMGKTYDDQILDHIFSSFCIGK